MPDFANSPRQGAAKLDSVEALRGVAVCLVVAFHATRICETSRSYGGSPFAGLWHFGQAGVDVFFVLSGFIIAYVHWDDLGDRSRFRPFWNKRLVRIYPPYWLATALFGMLLAFSPTELRLERNLPHVIASLLLMPDGSEPVLGVAWSLRHEMLFYAVFGFAILSRTIGVALLCVWGSAVVIAMVLRIFVVFSIADSTFAAVALSSFNAEFFFGIAVAVCVRAASHWRPSLVASAGALGFVAIGLLQSFVLASRPDAPLLVLAYASASAMLLYGLATLDLMGRARTPRWMVGLGAASYSIYLVHVPVMLVAEYAIRLVRQLVQVPADVTFSIIVLVAVAAGIMFSKLAERPLLRIGRHVLGADAPTITVRTA